MSMQGTDCTGVVCGVVSSFFRSELLYQEIKKFIKPYPNAMLTPWRVAPVWSGIGIHRLSGATFNLNSDIDWISNKAQHF